MVNYILADLVVRLKVGSRSHLKSIKILKTKLSIKILDILYKVGIIRGFFICKNESLILVYLKYYNNRCCFYDISLISKPGRRVYLTNNNLALHNNANTFSGFYIISTSRGLRTHNDIMLGSSTSGEVLLKVKV